MTKQEWQEEIDKYTQLIEEELERPEEERRDYMIEAWHKKRNGCYTAQSYAPDNNSVPTGGYVGYEIKNIY